MADYTGTDGADRIWGTEVNDFILGGDGDDILDGQGGDDRIDGGGGSDRINGGSGRDTIDGGAGNDLLGGGPDTEADIISGGDGNDHITVGYGDSADGGAGIDRFILQFFNAPAGITADLRQLVDNGTIQIGGGTLTNLEHVNSIGLTAFNDVIVAGVGPANPQSISTSLLIDGLGGNDHLTGSDARDTIRGGDGNDILVGGVGYNPEIGGDVLIGDRGNDVIYGGPDRSFISGGEGDDQIYGGAGSETADGGDGDDRIDLGGGDDYGSGDSGRDVLTGGTGDDVLAGGDGEDELNGGDGDDRIDGGGGSFGDDETDVISGGAGDDEIRGSIGDTIDGGAGRDRLSLFIGAAAGSQGLSIDFTGLDSGGSIILGGGVISGVEEIGELFLTDQDDTIVLGFQTGAGSSIFGRGGNDRLTGSSRDDDLFGESGDDALNGEGGDDTLDGGRGDDLLDGGSGNDFLIGDVPSFDGAGGRDRLFGQAGDDTLVGFGGDDELIGGDGDDILVEQLFGSGQVPGDADRMDGGGGRDFLAGGRGADMLNGGDGDDMLVTDDGSNVVRTQAGYSFQFFGSDGGDDVIDGGAGDDIAFLFYGGRAAALTLDNSAAGAVNTIFSGGVSASTITGVERLFFYGGAGGDAITGGAARDVLQGFAGDDVLRGGGGDDSLSGGVGNDVLDGGAGSDSAGFFAAATVDLNIQGTAQNTGEGLDTLIGVENLIGSRGSDRFTGDAADNRFTDNTGGDDRFFGGGGADRITVTRSGITATDVRLHGDDGNDILTFDGSERYVDAALLSGGAGADIIIATGARSADIDAGEGDDRVTVQQAGGFNSVALGSGADTLALVHADTALSSGWRIDVADFATGAGGDALDLAGFLPSEALAGYAPGSNPFAGGFLRLAQSGTSTVLQYDKDGGGDDFSTLITFRNAAAAAFTAANLGGFEQAATVAGTGGADLLSGGAGAQRLDGGAGDDRLTGGAGDDLLDGGAGVDTAVFAALFRSATVEAAGGAATVRGPDGVDLLAGVEVLQFADGRYVIDPDSAGASIQRLYHAALDRAPDAAGLEYWLDEVNDAGRGLSAVAAAFLGSGEFRAAGADVVGDGAFVDFLYRATLDREADAGGRDYWTGRLGGGLARADALLAFSESAEHRADTAALVERGYFETDDDHQTVALLYDAFAGRLPDAGGLAYFAGQLKAGRAVAEIADAFAASAEFRAATAGMSNGRIVDRLYETTLDRAADPASRDYWTGRLDGGLSTGSLLLEFALSDEHRQLFSYAIVGGIDVA